MGLKAWTHEDMHTRGLLDDELDPAAMAAWPEGARQHFEACPRCQARLRLDRALQSFRRELRSPERAPPMPSIESLKARAARRSVAPLEGFARPLPPFGEDTTYRGAESALELARTQEGVRAWDPDARHLLLFGLPAGGRPELLKQSRSDTPGVGLEAPFQPPAGGRVIAMAAWGQMLAPMWRLWLADVFHQPGARLPDPDAVNDRLHVAELVIPPPIHRAHIRVQSEPLPPPVDSTQTLLREAAAAGRGGDSAAAAAMYRRALERARTEGGGSGKVMASLGLALALQGLGYEQDSDTLLRQLLEEETLDPHHGWQICWARAQQALLSMEIERGAAWLTEAQRLSPDNPWLTLWSRFLEHLRGDIDGVEARYGGDWLEKLPSGAARVARCMEVIQLVRAGRADAAARRLEDISLPPRPSPIQALSHLSARAHLQQARGRVDWSALVESARGYLRRLDGKVFPRFAAYFLAESLELALDGDDPEAAGALAALRFVHTDLAARSAAQLLAALSGPSGVILLPPDGRPRRTHLDRANFLHLAARARQAVQAGDIDRGRALMGHLLPTSVAPSGPTLVVSDGLLDDLPLAALVGRGTPTPLREMTAARRDLSRLSLPISPGVASLADAWGDLPGAAAEVTEDEARHFLRGNRVTRAALASLPLVGLLHLSVHARRTDGGPVLMLADGPLGAPELGCLELLGAPVVLLSGCATGAATTARGVERSLADAFLRAGARAVIATRWPVRDGEMHHFVRALLSRWPFQDPAPVVAEVCHHLRLRGLPARLWAAPTVY